MRIIERIDEMARWSECERRQGRRLAFVPTMGFLHEGHLQLVRDARRRGDRAVVSIFVNPTQFAPGEDFAAYPRDLERDRGLLEKEGVDVLFHPAAEEMYPDGFQTHVAVETLGSFLCGPKRPGHFRAVATVVAKLFNIVRPDVAIFGEKDYQQLAIVRRLVRDLNYPIEIVGHPTVREPDGLALSSRNVYLNAEERKAAVCLFRALGKAACAVRRGAVDAARIIAAARAEIDAQPLARVDYIELCDPVTLEDVQQLTHAALLAIAVRIGKTRLIDNTILKR
ncbi:MAG TPA: pantoate--beta-alanine ligase [Candidatus Eisenbacteria bacterium]|nr:pantoate--beta-alanine ligase [Candidatus Eisenbacteria bacterium]